MAAADVSLLLLAAIVLAVGFATYRLFDFHVFWRASRDILHGRSPYPRIDSLAASTRDYYVYPPLVALLVTPLAPMPFALAGALFSVLLVGAVCVALRLLGVNDWRVYAAPFVWVATVQAVATGTVAPLLVLGLAVAWRYRERLAVAALAIAGILLAKLFLWPLVVWLIATRRFAVAAVAVVGGGVAALASWAVIGFGGLSSYPSLLRALVRVEGNRSFSLPALAHSLGLPHSAGLGIMLVACCTSIAGIALLSRRPDGDRRAFSAAICLSIVLSPIVWLHYYSLLLVPIALMRRQFGVLWLVPAVLFLPYGDSGAVTWRITLPLAVTALVLYASCGSGAGFRRGRGVQDGVRVPVDLAQGP